MKTTIEISDNLLRQARKLADREGVTLRALVERALNRVLRETKQTRGFKLRDAAFTGNGLQPGFTEGSWEDVRQAIYEDRGA